TINLTSARARTQLRARLAARWLFLEDAPLIALDEACRTRETRPEPPRPTGAWTKPLASLLDDVERLVGRSLVFTSPPQGVAVTLWVAPPHALEAFDVTPYLDIHSPEKRSGKSRLQEVLNELVPRPELTSRLTEAATFRLIESDDGPPVLLIDEVDTIFGG